MTFDVLVGQQSAKSRLVRTLRDGRSHAFLITGPDGSGKSRSVRLRFRNRTEAAYFQSCFKQ